MISVDQLNRLFSDLRSKDDKIRYAAFKQLTEETENEVLWVYDRWYELEEKLRSENSFQRNIGLVLLANLAKSDKDNRLGNSLGFYLSFFDDEKFITARQCIQNVWKIAVVHEINRRIILKKLEETWYENGHNHKNLIKQDVISSLAHIAYITGDLEITEKINSLINSELDEKLKKSLRKMLK